MTELKRCPFCGGEAEWAYLVPDGAIIGCKDAYSANPKCRVKPEIRRYRGDKEKSLEVAISDWNTRPNPWHTGTPSEGGTFLVCLKDGTYDIYEFGKEYKAWDIGFSDVVKWQKIEEKEDGCTD